MKIFDFIGLLLKMFEGRNGTKCCSALDYFLACLGYACQGRPVLRAFILPLTCIAGMLIKILWIDSVPKINTKLVQGLAPVP